MSTVARSSTGSFGDNFYGLLRNEPFLIIFSGLSNFKMHLPISYPEYY